MPKKGILHDYDLMANAEKSASDQTCAVCGSSPVVFQWSDYSGEAMCIKCGCPYQLKWGSDEQKKEGKYPYLNFLESFVPIAKEYWEKHREFVCYGTMLGPQPGMDAFISWAKKNHPEILKKEGE